MVIYPLIATVVRIRSAPPLCDWAQGWLSIDIPAGAYAVIYLLVQTAKANGLESYSWLRRVLRDLSAAQTVEAGLRRCCLGTCVQ